MATINLRLSLDDGTEIAAEFVTIGLCAKWLAQFHHVIHCRRQFCARGIHNTRYPPREFKMIIECVDEGLFDEKYKHREGYHVDCLHPVTDGKELVPADYEGMQTVLHWNNEELSTEIARAQPGEMFIDTWD